MSLYYQDETCRDCFEKWISGWVPNVAHYLAEADRLDGDEDTP